MTTLPTIPDEYREKAARLVYGLECYGISFELITEEAREEDIMSIARALVEEQNRHWELEVDDGCLVLRNCGVSITVRADTATVYAAESGYCARFCHLGEQLIDGVEAARADLSTHSAAAPLEAR